MKFHSTLAASILAAFAASAVSPVASAATNLLVNGGFEDSSSTTVTPPGWFNFGGTNGVLTYSAIPQQPVYEGLRFYDIGAHNNGFASVGEGLGQTFATVVGARYKLSFGYSGENVPNSAVETLRVSAGDSSRDYVLTPNGDPVFTRAMTSESFDFMATGSTTTLSFILQAIVGSPGNNDPMFDGVMVELISAPVPEPETYALMAVGLFAVAGAGIRRRRG